MKRSKSYTIVCGFLLLLASLSACSHEEGPIPSPDSDLVTFLLQVQTHEGVGTKAGKDPKEQEYIHSLTVLLTNSDGTILRRWYDMDAKGGSKKNWTSEEISLETGNYVAYAFANMESLPEEGDNFLNALTENRSVYDLDNKVVTMFKDENLYDPNAEVSPTYLPMSRCFPFTLSKNTGTITIPLVRMLSRVEVSVERDGGRTESISNFIFSGFVDKMNLFVFPDVLNDKTSSELDNLLMVPSGTTTSYKKEGVLEEKFYFYVSETKKQGADKFTINLNLNDTPIGERTLTRTVLVRNRIWPIHLVIKETQCKFKFEAYNQPIGGAPEDIKPITDEDNAYNLAVKGGGNFTLTLEEVYPTGTPDNEIEISKWRVENWETIKGLIYSKYDTGESTTSPFIINGRIPSVTESDIEMTVIATDAGEKEHTFTFKLSATDLFSKTITR